MANNLRKFNTYSDYEAAELVKPAVSLIAATDEVYFDQKEAPVPPTPTFSGLKVHYNITDISQPTELFNGGGSGSGSGSGSGGVLPSAMIIDGTAVEVTNTYQFSTTGEHIVNYSFEDNAIPEQFLEGWYDSVTKVEIGDAITSIGIVAFASCTGLTSCTIGSGVTSIGNQAFSGCTSLTSINIPSGVTSIADSTFEGCSGLTSIDIPDSVTSIDGGAFIYCSSLTSCTIGSGVTSISDAAFQSCSGLTSIDLPSGVTSIGGGAFTYCSGLTSITVEAVDPPQLGRDVFIDTNDCPIYVPSQSVDEYKNSTSTGWYEYASRIQAIQ